MHRLRAAGAVLGFVLLAMVLMPLVVFDFNAASEDFPVVRVCDNGYALEHESAAPDVASLLRDLGIYITDHDTINYPGDFPLYDGMFIRLVRKVAFYMAVDSMEAVPMTVPGGTTVEAVLAQAQRAHGGVLYYFNDIQRPVVPGDALYFFSWRSRSFTELEEIPYETIEYHTGAIRYGRVYQRQQGEPGERELTTTVVYIGGSEASRKISGDTVLVEPIALIYDIGTAPLGALTDTSDPAFRYIRRVRMQATAYCACFRCTGRQPGDRHFGITASGRHVEHGIVAVDRTVIPLGTHLYVANYGFSLAADVGGAIRGYRIDLFMYCHEEARQFGRRYVYVYILN